MDEYRLHASLVTHWRAGRLEPWPAAAAATETVWFALPEQPNGVRYWEGLNGRLEADGSATVLGVPAYACRLNLGDRVAVVRSAEGPLVATGIVRDAGNCTFRFFLSDAADQTAWHPLAQEFAAMGVIFRRRVHRCPKSSTQTIFFNSGPHGISEVVSTLRRSVS